MINEVPSHFLLLSTSGLEAHGAAYAATLECLALGKT